jgi:Ca2+-binding EF-hand superfamily protein
MKTLFFASVLMMCTMPALAGENVSIGTCKSWFDVIDRNNDGTISRNEGAVTYLNKITLGESGKSSNEFVMQKAFFLRECAIGSLGKPAL